MDGLDLSWWHTLQHDVFVSFSFSDQPTGDALDVALRADFDVFYAPRSLPVDVQRQARFQFATVLADELARSAHCVALVSPRYLASAWCQLELLGFANLHREDRARQLWLFEVEPCRDDVPMQLRGMLHDGDLPSLIATVRAAVAASRRRRGHDFDGTPPAPLPPLPLHALYPMPRPAPWAPDGRSRGHPAGPPYAVYEALVRETMVQLLRRGADDPFADVTPWLEVPMDGLDPRLQGLPARALEDARQLLVRSVGPFHTRRPYREICVELMFQAGAGGATPALLAALAECRAHMGPASRREALDLCDRVEASGADSASVRRWRALALHLDGDDEAALGAYAQADPLALQGPDWKLLAAARARLGAAAAAADALARLRALDPGFDLAEEALHSMLEDNADLAYWLGSLTLAMQAAAGDAPD